MKKINSCLFILGLFNGAFAQEKTGKDSLDPQNIKVVTNRDPSYPKGEQALYTYVLYGVKYSEEAKKKYIEGEVTLSFDVMADSTLKNVNVVGGVGYGIDEEVKRLVSSLKFSPALQNGIPVKMNLVMSFPVKAH